MRCCARTRRPTPATWPRSARRGRRKRWPPKRSACAWCGCAPAWCWTPRGGALKRMLPPFRMGVGGKLGDGRQWMSWIHLADLAAMFQYAVENPVRGALNGVAPIPVTNADFTQTLARALHRPAHLPGAGICAEAAVRRDVGSPAGQPESAARRGGSCRVPVSLSGTGRGVEGLAGG